MDTTILAWKSQKGKERLEMVTIEATCVDCGRVFSYSCIRKPKKPMKRCPKCAWKNYAGKYIAKHRFGFDIEERVVLRDKQSGKIYR